MKSPWRVTMQYICGKPQYAVYRLRDVSKVDHSGNRESGSTYMDSKEEAERIAAELNAKEAGGRERSHDGSENDNAGLVSV